MLLRRLNYPKRLEDLVQEFGRHIADLGIIFNEMVYFIDHQWSHLIDAFDKPWLNEASLRAYADAVHELGCPLNNCCGFVDGTLIQSCRPEYDQRELYNGKNRVHGLKYQAVVMPNGLVAHFYGPMSGRRHDATLLRESQILQKIRNMRSTDGLPLVLYGDKAYALDQNLITPYRGVDLTVEQREFNYSMNKGRIAVEWTFGKVSSLFAFVKFAPNQKLYLQPIGSYYKVATIITNCHSCCYESQTSKHFGLVAPSLEEYLQQAHEQ